MSNEKLVLVTGGTGSQGGATVTHLLAAKKVRVRVLTRNLELAEGQEPGRAWRGTRQGRLRRRGFA